MTMTVAEYARIIKGHEQQAADSIRARKVLIRRAADIHGEAAIAEALGLHKGHVWRIANEMRRAAE